MPPWGAEVRRETFVYNPSLSIQTGNITGVGREVSAYDTFDGQMSYHLAKAWTFTVGVINIANTAPPYANYALIGEQLRRRL